MKRQTTIIASLLLVFSVGLVYAADQQSTTATEAAAACPQHMKMSSAETPETCGMNMMKDGAQKHMKDSKDMQAMHGSMPANCPMTSEKSQTMSCCATNKTHDKTESAQHSCGMMNMNSHDMHHQSGLDDKKNPDPPCHAN